MKLKREFLICIIIIFLVIFLDITINNHFEKEMNVIQKNISDLQELVREKENVKEKVEELKKNWERFDYIAAYYTEHNELEKVSLKINLVKKNIETGENDMTVEYLEELKFLLNHICEKDKLSLKNIF